MSEFEVGQLSAKEQEKAERKAREGGTRAEIWRTVKFALFSCSAGIIQFASTTFLIEVCKLDNDHGLYWLSYLIGLILSVLWNFTFNRKFTFQSANNVALAMSLTFAYYLVFTPCSLLWTDAWLDLDGWQELELVVTLITILINGVTEFLWQRLFVYRKSINTNKSALQRAEHAAIVDVKTDTFDAEGFFTNDGSDENAPVSDKTAEETAIDEFAESESAPFESNLNDISALR